MGASQAISSECCCLGWSRTCPWVLNRALFSTPWPVFLCRAVSAEDGKLEIPAILSLLNKVEVINREKHLWFPFSVLAAIMILGKRLQRYC